MQELSSRIQKLKDYNPNPISMKKFTRMKPSKFNSRLNNFYGSKDNSMSSTDLWTSQYRRNTYLLKLRLDEVERQRTKSQIQKQQPRNPNINILLQTIDENPVTPLGKIYDRLGMSKIKKSQTRQSLKLSTSFSMPKRQNAKLFHRPNQTMDQRYSALMDSWNDPNNSIDELDQHLRSLSESMSNSFDDLSQQCGKSSLDIKKRKDQKLYSIASSFDQQVPRQKRKMDLKNVKVSKRRVTSTFLREPTKKRTVHTIM